MTARVGNPGGTPMDFNEAVRIRLMAIPFMTQFDSALRAKVAKMLMGLGKVQKVPRHTRLFTEGDDATDAGVLILDGTFTVDKPNAPQVVAEGPDLLGEMVQFNPQKKRTANVTTDSELHLIRFSWAKFKEHASKMLNADEAAKVTAALQDHAWRHFTQ